MNRGENIGHKNLEQAVARARQAEMMLLNSDAIIRQEFSVEITKVKPVKQKTQSRLDVWSDGGRRYFAQWAGSKEEIKFAAWQASDGRRFVLEPASSGRIVPAVARAPSTRVHLSDHMDVAADDNEIEAAFLGWLRSRRWSSIRLGDDIAELVSGNDYLVRLEKLQSDGGGVLRVSARKTGDGREIQLLFEIDEPTNQIRAQQLLVRDAHGEAILRIALRQVRVIPAREVSSAVRIFEPPLAKNPVSRPKLHSREASGSGSRVAPVPPLPDVVLERKVELLELLHHIGADMGEELAVGRRLDGGLTIEGIVDSRRRRDQITALVDKLMGGQFVTLRILDNESGWPVDQYRAFAWNPPAFPQPMNPAGVLIGGLIEMLFAEQPSGDTAQRYLQRLSELHWSIVTEAWSLRMLSEAVLPWEEQRLTSQSRDRLQSIVRAHRVSLNQNARDLRSSLVRLAPASAQSVSTCDLRPHAAWQIESDRIFRDSQSLTLAFQSLISPDGQPSTAAAARAGVRRYLALLDCVAGNPDQTSR
jgi:hypothetical protein